MKFFAASAALLIFAGICCAGENKTHAPLPKPKAAEKKALIDDSSAYSAINEFLTTLAVIREHYVDAEKVTWKKLFHSALVGIVHELDPFSEYEDPETFQARQQDISGNKVGIGIVIARRARGIEIAAVLPGSPAQKAGLKSGDVIVDLDNESAENMSLSTASSRLRGEQGADLLINVYRPAADSVLPFLITRAKFHINTVAGARILPGTDGLGYMRLTQFGRTVTDDFDKAAAELTKQGMKALIFDLRDNPGGLVDSVVPLCSRFLKAKQPVVSIEGRDEGKRVLLSDDKDGVYAELPLIVLVNGNTASAAEIFAACMRDYHRAVLIGEKTYGKGSVQALFTTNNGSALRLTTALYFTPGRHRIHGRGILPDIEINLSPAVRTRMSSQLATHPGQRLPMVQNPVRDIVLERSIEVFKGMKIIDNQKKTR